MSTFNARPCVETPRCTRTPIAATFAPSIHTPGRPPHPLAAEPEGLKDIDHVLLEQPHVVTGTDLPRVQIEDRIRDKLPRPVERDIPASIDGDDRCPTRCQRRLGDQHVRGVSARTKGVHRLMLNQRQRLR